LNNCALLSDLKSFLMKILIPICVLLFFAVGCSSTKKGPANSAPLPEGWVSLFDGKTLEGWKANENPGTFRVVDGSIVVHGEKAHLFYQGPVMDHNFKNFEFKAQVRTMPGANSGIYFHTGYQDGGWPAKGYEVQVNNSHTDWRRTGSLYAVQDVKEKLVADEVWYTEHIIVQDKKVTIKINDQTVVEYTEPPQVWRPQDMAGRVISRGTFALQGHDPQSQVFFKDIMVKPLPDGGN
jgi:hypothetical protein